MQLSLLTLLASAAAAWAHACPVCPVASTSVVAHDGASTGSETTFGGYTMYVARPPGNVTVTRAVLYLTDVFGIQLAQNRLYVFPLIVFFLVLACLPSDDPRLADSFARAGFLTVAPDLFNGTPAPGDINVPGFNTTAFLAQHGAPQTDPAVAAGLAYLRSLGAKRIGATGYCFGGRYAFRAGSSAIVSANRSASAIFAAHPSLLSDDEISAVLAPASVAAAETDGLMPPERRTQITGLLQKTGQDYSLAVYGGTSHGFGVRADVTDVRQKFAKEEAFLQAVRWFSTWL